MAAHEFEPMSVGQILDRTFRLYRENFLHFVTVVAVVQVPVALITLLLVTASAPVPAGHVSAVPAGQPAGWLLSLVGAFLALLVYVLSSGALVKSVSEAYLGNEVSVGASYRFVLPKIGALVLAAILVYVVILLGLVLLVVPGIIFSLWLVLTSQVVIVEDRNAIAAMGRSRALTSGNLGKVFGVGFLALVIGLILGYAFGRLGMYVAHLVDASGGVTSAVVREIATVVGGILAAPIGAIAFILLYYDLRIRKEGFDLEMLAQTMGAKEA